MVSEKMYNKKRWKECETENQIRKNGIIPELLHVLFS
jgi:hypothetical protein